MIASKEMYIGRYYFEKKKWVAAINRFRTVVDEYDTTIYSEEAIHRLVEIHYKLGLKEEAIKIHTSLNNLNPARADELDEIINCKTNC